MLVGVVEISGAFLCCLHRCRAKQRPPGQRAIDRSVTLPAVWGRSAAVADLTKAPPPASRRRYARWWFGGRCAGLRGLPRRLVPRHVVSPSQSLHFVVLEPLAGRSRRHRSCRRFRRKLRMPDAVAPASPGLRSLEAPLVRVCQASSCAAAWLWRVAPRLRLRRFVLKGRHTHAFAFSGFLGGCRRFGRVCGAGWIVPRSRIPEMEVPDLANARRV